MFYVISNDSKGDVLLLDSKDGSVVKTTSAKVQEMVDNNQEIKGAHYDRKYSWNELATLEKAFAKDKDKLNEFRNEKVFVIDTVWKIGENDSYILIACSSEGLFPDGDSCRCAIGSSWGKTCLYILKKGEDGKIIKGLRIYKLNDYQGSDEIDFKNSKKSNGYANLYVSSMTIDIEYGGHYDNHYNIDASIGEDNVSIEIEYDEDYDDLNCSNEELEDLFNEIGFDIN